MASRVGSVGPQEATLKIAIDGSQLLGKTGTGIASYARTLAGTQRDMGYSVSVLFGQPVREGKQNSALNIASQIFGNVPEPRRFERLVRTGVSMLRAKITGSATAVASKISSTGIDLSAVEPPLPHIDIILNANRLYERADLIFRATERMTGVRLPSDISIAHWTSPLPVMAKNMPNVYTLHDLIPIQFPYFVLDRNGGAARLHQAIARAADLIVTVSETSKRHIVDLLNVSDDRVSVTYQPVPPMPIIPQEDAERLVRNIYGATPGGYAIFLGAIEPKKNLKRLIEAFLLANVNIPLLIAGPLGWLYQGELDMIAAVNKNAASTSIRHLGFLPRRHVTALLQCARLFTFPSICEGFGLPVLEAMKLGVPVLTSNISSLPEVAGDAAVLVDPLSVEDLSKGIRSLASDTNLRTELVRRGYMQADKFSLDAYRGRLADAYRRVI